jgi:hypothetical protein
MAPCRHGTQLATGLTGRRSFAVKGITGRSSTARRYLGIVLAPLCAGAAPGDLDTTFGSGGKVTTAIGAGDDEGHAMAIDGSGRIVVAGGSYNGTNIDFAVVRYLGGSGGCQ